MSCGDVAEAGPSTGSEEQKFMPRELTLWLISEDHIADHQARNWCDVQTRGPVSDVNRTGHCFSSRQ